LIKSSFLFLFLFIILFKFKAENHGYINLLDSAKTSCTINRSFIKTNDFINEVISQAKKYKADSILAEAYLIKAQNYFYEAINYSPKNSSGHVFDWGLDCENCKPELFSLAKSFNDSVIFFLPYNYSRYKILYSENIELIIQINEQHKRMIPTITITNLKLAKEKNKMFSYLLIMAAIIIVLIVYFLFLNSRKNKKINLLLKKVEVKNQEIIDSIIYAKRIQNAIMTSEKYIDKVLKRLQG